MIKLKGNNAYFLPNVHKSNLSTFPLNKICKDSFTFCVRVKINWDKMEADTLKSWGWYNDEKWYAFRISCSKISK